MSGHVVVPAEPCPWVAVGQPSARSCDVWAWRCTGCMCDGTRALLYQAVPVEAGVRPFPKNPLNGKREAVWVPVDPKEDRP